MNTLVASPGWMRGNELPTDLDAGPRRVVFVMVALMMVFAVVAVVWATFAHVDVSVSAPGAVVAPSRVQEVQSLEGGIVRELLVQPGQKVRKGDILVRLDSAQYDADLGESRQSMLAINAARIRIDALLAGTAPKFGALEQEAPEIVREERRLWQEAQREYRSAVTTAGEGVRRRIAERTETMARIEALKPSLVVATESFEIEDRLYQQGAGARADYLAAKARLLQQQIELDSLRKSLPRLDAAIAEGRAQASEIEARMRSQWTQQRTELEGQASTLGSTMKGREDRVARRELVSPMDGIVNRVLIPTRGGVAAAGAPILEIVPVEEGLRTSVRIRPQDIGFVHVGQQASISVAAYDASIYGKLDSVVERVGADTLLDENKQPYFEVSLRSQKDHLDHAGKSLAITTGMSVDASILTGKRTVLQYVLKPVFKTFDSALQER